MRRTIGIALLTTAAVVWAEILLQTPLYRWLQPTILTPHEGAVVSPPLLVHWDGPKQLRLSLVADGKPPLDLGLRTSPTEIGAGELPTPGSYRLEAQTPIFGSLIQTVRRFTVSQPAAKPRPGQPSDTKLTSISSALNSLRAAHEQTQAENAALYEENAGLRHENALLLQEIERSEKAQEEAASRASAQLDRQTQLMDENQVLSDRLSNLQWQLSTALSCSVWGYYSFPRPQNIPPNRRIVTVSNLRGDIFRREADCEAQRQMDPAAASRCFCIDTPWPG